MAQYHYHLNSQGIISHEGIIIEDESLIEMIYKNIDSTRMEPSDTVSFCARIGNEEIFVHCEDSHIVWKYISETTLHMTTNIAFPFSINDIRFSQDGNLYHRAQIGNWARISARLLIEIRDHIHTWGPYYLYEKDGFSRVIEPLEKSHRIFLHPRLENQCFGCGLQNTHGLHMTFVFDSLSNSVETWYTPPKHLMGSLNVMHGGMVSLLLDETMGKVLSGMNIKAPTAQLNVRYKRPTPVENQLYIQGRLISAQGRKYSLIAEIFDSEGNMTAQGEGLFIQRKASVHD